MGISEYLVKLEELTNTNLELLKALNASFYTNQNHLSVNLAEGAFVIPSFLSLENKINSLQSNFENLVNAPLSSEAFFTFDGNSRAIEVRKYEQSPAPTSLTNQTQFYHENNQVLKDFLSPIPYLKFDINGLPNDITNVVVRKVIALSDNAKSKFALLLDDTEEVQNASNKVSWGDFAKVLDGLTLDVDYTLYDTTKTLPIREGQGHGSYVIREIVDQYIDDNLDQHIIFRLANDIDGFQKSLTYVLFDQTIERNLSIGDYIVSWDGRVKFQIEELNFNTNSIKTRVCFGDYTDMIPFTDSVGDVNEMSKLRYFSNTDAENLFKNQNYVKVPLEEDKYVYIAIAALNNRMNIRASWGDGLIVDVDRLINADPSEGSDASFRTYYETCRNIGDILNEISKVMSNTVTNHTNDEINRFTTVKPILESEILKVVHINKHLDETTTIKNIRSLYSQKNTYNADLTETQSSLTACQEELSTINFEDTTGVRAKLQNQIDELTKHKNELINSLIKVSNEIALTANNSLVPIENAKYRIRGFFDFVGFTDSLRADGLNITEKNIKGIYVQYRYRNIQQEIGTATTFVKDVDNNGVIDDSDRTFIFSDWNELHTPLRPRIRTANGNYEAEEDTSNKNLPSFNQIDIPITQGEIVDVRLKVIYDFGYPFIQIYSAWSDIMSFDFPEEFIKDVDITTIIEENNSDIETNRFNSILSDNGIIDHVNDKILDQDVVFYHKPENISSGFYTEERRIIPLRDKLKDMNDQIIQIFDEINGESAEQLQVSIEYDESSIAISPYEVGNIILKSFDSFSGNAGTVGNYEWSGEDDKVISLMCNIRLTNTSDHSLKIFPMFPGGDGIALNVLTTYMFDPKPFFRSKSGDSTDQSEDSAVWMSVINDSNQRVFAKQTTNQIITFRTQNPWDGQYYYGCGTSYTDATGPYLPSKTSGSPAGLPLGTNGMMIYPYIIKKDGIKCTFKEASKYMLLNKNDDIVIPMLIQYSFKDDSTNSSYKKTISFDVRTSMYTDPMTYTFTVQAPKSSVIEDKLVSVLTKKYNNKELNDRKYRSIVR